MESKIIEYRIILLHKYKVEQTISNFQIFIHIFTHKFQEHLIIFL